MTQEARGLDPEGLLLLDVVVSGGVPESLADADLQVQVGAAPKVRGWGRGRAWDVLPQASPPDTPAGAGVSPGPDSAQWEDTLGPASPVSSPFHT